jgi:proline-specific peptidase
MSEKFAEVNGIKICYEILGEGYPVILVHGFGSKKESWMAQFSILSQKYKVIRLDNRGAGKSDRPDMSYTMEIFVEDIRALMDFLNISRAHFLGFSLGGTILQHFTLKYPERVNKLVLINSVAKIPEAYGPDMFINSHLKGLELLKVDPVKAFWHGAKTGFYMKFRKEMESNPKKKFYNLWSVMDLINYYKTLPPTPQDIKNLAHALTTIKAFEKLNEIQCNTLILTASHDRLVPKSVMYEIHKKIPNSIFKVIDNAGHESSKEKAPEVNEAILNFLES